MIIFFNIVSSIRFLRVVRKGEIKIKSEKSEQFDEGMETERNVSDYVFPINKFLFFVKTSTLSNNNSANILDVHTVYTRYID